MTDTLLHAYTPLLVWTGLGLIIVRLLPKAFPRFLGRGLYWVGVPLQIFTLARQTDWSGNIFIAPTVTVAALLLGLAIVWLLLQSLPWLRALRHPAAAVEADEIPSTAEPGETPEGDRPTPTEETAIALPASIWDQPARRGSLFLATMLGNTGFVGLAVVPTFLDEHYLGWIVFYSVAHNLIGTYGIGVFVASYFSRQAEIHLGSSRQPSGQRWLMLAKDVLTVPSLWAFVCGISTRSIEIPQILETGLHGSIFVIVPSALLLMGMRLAQLNGWSSLRLAIAPATIKVLVIPVCVGLATSLLHFAPYARLGMVLMSGMPTAFGGLILAEEYDLDRELIASSIVLSSVMLLVMIPLWLVLFPVME